MVKHWMSSDLNKRAALILLASLCLMMFLFFRSLSAESHEISNVLSSENLDDLLITPQYFMWKSFIVSVIICMQAMGFFFFLTRNTVKAPGKISLPNLAPEDPRPAERNSLKSALDEFSLSQMEHAAALRASFERGRIVSVDFREASLSFAGCANAAQEADAFEREFAEAFGPAFDANPGWGE